MCFAFLLLITRIRTSYQEQKCEAHDKYVCLTYSICSSYSHVLRIFVVDNSCEYVISIEIKIIQNLIRDVKWDTHNSLFIIAMRNLRRFEEHVEYINMSFRQKQLNRHVQMY
jgi:hypothetical protein